MRYKFTLVVILTLVALALPTLVRPSAAKTSLDVSVDCIYTPETGNLECRADVYGGTSPYTFQWTPTPLIGGGSGGMAIIGCARFSERTVSVTVTDINGNTGSTSHPFQCYGGGLQ